MKIVNEANKPGEMTYNLYDISKNKAIDLIYDAVDKGKRVIITYHDRYAKRDRTTDPDETGEQDVKNLVYVIRYENCLWMTIKDGSKYK